MEDTAPLDRLAWELHVLGKPAVDPITDDPRIRAQVFLAVLAVIASQAGNGGNAANEFSLVEILDALAHLGDVAGKLVT